MCPVSTTALLVASIAISTAAAVGTTVMQQQAAQQSANAAQAAQDAEIEHDREVAKNQYAAYRDAANRLNLRDSQERERAAQEAFDAKLQTIRQRETARAASSGVAGISVDALLGDFDFAGGRAQNTITANLNDALEQSSAERRSLFSPVQSAFMQANRYRRAITGPSPAALGLGIAGNIAGGVTAASSNGLFTSSPPGGGVTATQAQGLNIQHEA